MRSFDGIYENGVVLFPGPIDIPEGAKVTVVVLDALQQQPPIGSNSPQLYEILRHRYATDETDLVARVGELHP